MLPNTDEIGLENLADAVAARTARGYRFVTISCTDLGDRFDLIYHFDLNYNLMNLRVSVPKGAELPTVGHICPASVLVENEIKDLFGLEVAGLAVDYEGRFLLSKGAAERPFAKVRGAGKGD
jgi:Ni,Fe-hydrogenase III component G